MTPACVFAPLLLVSWALLMLMGLFSGVAEEGADRLCEPLHPSLLPLRLVLMLRDDLLDA